MEIIFGGLVVGILLFNLGLTFKLSADLSKHSVQWAIATEALTRHLKRWNGD